MKHISSISKISFFIFYFLFSILYLHAQPGILDTNFGVNGKLPLNTIPSCIDLAVQKDDKILSLTEHQIIRLNKDGVIDEKFGANGMVNLDGGEESGYNSAISIITVKDEKSLTIGYGYSTVIIPGVSICINRFLNNGDKDSTFGNNGITAIPFSNGINTPAAYPCSVIEQPDGKILVAGNYY